LFFFLFGNVEKLSIFVGNKKQNMELIQFKNSEERASMIYELKDVLNLKANFETFNDSVFSYYLQVEDLNYEFNFIVDDFLFKEMTVQDILDLKDVGYFSSTIRSEMYSEVKGTKTFRLIP